MSTTAETLMADAKCHICNLSPGMVPYAVLAILNHLRDGETMSTDAQTLMTEAQCLMCKISPGAVPYAMLAALAGILSGGGLGGGVSYGTSDPVTAPPGDSGWYYRTDTGALWVWNSATSAWDAIIA